MESTIQKVRDPNGVTSKPDTLLRNHPLLLPEIVERVVHLVDSKDTFTACQSVCSVWKKEFSQKIAKEKFQLYESSLEGISELVPTSNYQILRLRVSDDEDADLDNSVITFFRNYCTHLNHFILTTSKWNRKHNTLVKEILFRWCLRMKEIDLCWVSSFHENIMEEEESVYFQDIQLKCLHLRTEFNQDVSNVTTAPSLISKIFRYAQQLQTFSYRGNSSEHQAQYIKLASLNSYQLTNLELPEEILCSSDINTIRHAPWILKKIVMGGGFSIDVTTEHIYSLLETYKNSLEHLEIGGSKDTVESDRVLPLRVPMMHKLKELRLNISSLAISSSRLLSKLPSLSHLEILTWCRNRTPRSYQEKLAPIFENCTTSSVTSFSLDENYTWNLVNVSFLFKYVRKLELRCELGDLPVFFDAWRQVAGINGPLREIKINVTMSETSLAQNLSSILVKGLQQYHLNVLDLFCNYQLRDGSKPILSRKCVSKGIMGDGRTYDKLKINGLKIYDDEAEDIANLLARNAHTIFEHISIEKRGTSISSTVSLPTKIILENGNAQSIIQKYFHSF